MKNLYIDFDGVILDTMEVTYKMLEKLEINIKDPSNSEKISSFYANLNWNKVLNETPQINESIKNIHKIMKTKMFNVYILTHVNSLDEIVAKVNYIRKHIDHITVIPVPRQISKTRIVRAFDSILIDDFGENIKEWEEAGGIGIKFDKNLDSSKFKSINKLDQIINMNL